MAGPLVPRAFKGEFCLWRQHSGGHGILQGVCPPVTTIEVKPDERGYKGSPKTKGRLT